MPLSLTRTTKQRRLSRRLLGSQLVGALTTPHPVDRYLELVRPSWSLSDVRAEITEARRTSRGSITLSLRPNTTWQGFEAGQHVRVAVEIDGVRRTRCYSLAGSAHDDQLEVTVRHHAAGEVSGYLNRHARPGDVLQLSPAQGEFKLPDPRPEQLVLIAGGSGITPLMSMLRTLADECHDGQVTLLYYSPTADDTIYAAELAMIDARLPGLSLHHVHTRRNRNTSRYFERAQLAEVAPHYAAADAFVCGPPALVDSAETLWDTEAIEQPLQVEHFVPPAPALILGEAKGNIRFARSDLEAANDGRSLLEQAEAAGLEPEHGCRMGICHSCTCHKLSGSVRNLRTGEISTDPDEEIQICISAAVGDIELDI